MKEKIEMKKLLSMGNLKQTLDRLLYFFQENNTEAFDLTIIQSSNYNCLKKKQLEHTITPEFFMKEESKITKALLEIINGFIPEESQKFA